MEERTAADRLLASPDRHKVVLHADKQHVLYCIYITDLISLVHMPHSLSVQMSGPVSLVHMPHSLSVQTSGSAVYPPPHTLQLLAAVLGCLELV